MLKYLILSLIPLAYQATTHKTECKNKEIEKTQLDADWNDGEIFYSAICYNYDLDEDNSCSEKLEGPYAYPTDKGCQQYNEGTNEQGKVTQYHCDTKEKFDDWFEKLAKNKWYCQEYAIA